MMKKKMNRKRKEMRSSHVNFLFSNEPEMCDYAAVNK